MVEFVSTEHTPRNLLIRAVKRPGAAAAAAANRRSSQQYAEYQALRDYWGVTPYLETQLQDVLDQHADPSQ